MPLHDPDEAPSSGPNPSYRGRPSAFPPPASPVSRDDLLVAAGSALAPDSPELDSLIAGSYVRLMLTARDEQIRLEATRDLTRARGFFARAEAKAAVSGAAACAAISARPEVFARLLSGLGELGVVKAAAVEAVCSAAAESAAESATTVSPEEP